MKKIALLTLTSLIITASSIMSPAQIAAVPTTTLGQNYEDAETLAQAFLLHNTIAVNLTGVNGWGWSYDPSTGLLTISVFDQTTTDVGYTVTDGSGGLLAHGTLPFFQPIPGTGTGTNSVFDLHNAGGVLVLPLGRTNTSDNDYSFTRCAVLPILACFAGRVGCCTNRINNYPKTS